MLRKGKLLSLMAAGVFSLLADGIADAQVADVVSLGTFDHPLYLAAAPGYRQLLFVVEQPGRIQVLQNEQLLPDPFLDITDIVRFRGERGLLSIAFAPDYLTSRRFYVAFNNSNGDIELDEFLRSTGSSTQADKSSRRVVLSVPHPGAANHNGGQLQFGPRDGLLYMSTGDGGKLQPPGEPARDLHNLLGKILRINPLPSGGQEYSIPADNPFLDRDARGEIYAYGLRNPWRFSFRDTLMIIADVGRGAEEEINFWPTESVAGMNFGWPQYEGDQVFDNTRPGPDPAVFPILTYPHTNGRCAIIGGYVVRDPNLPALANRYLYGDLCTGEVRSMLASAKRQRVVDDSPTGVVLPNLSGFGRGSRNQIYLAQITGGVWRMVPAGP